MIITTPQSNKADTGRQNFKNGLIFVSLFVFFLIITIFLGLVGLLLFFYAAIAMMAWFVASKLFKGKQVGTGSVAAVIFLNVITWLYPLTRIPRIFRDYYAYVDGLIFIFTITSIIFGVFAFNLYKNARRARIVYVVIGIITIIMAAVTLYGDYYNRFYLRGISPF